MDISKGIWGGYLDQVERQVRTDGFMTGAMRRNLDRLRRGADEDTDARIAHLVARFHRPYAPARPPVRHSA
jgi:hypothetical protein